MTVWQAWHNAAADYIGCRVIALAPGYGLFDIRHGVIYRVTEGTCNQAGTARRATDGELAELDWMAAHGVLQIEVRPVTGVFRGQGGRGVASEQMQTIIVYQARGVTDGCRV